MESMSYNNRQSHLQSQESEQEELFSLMLPKNFYKRLGTGVKSNTKFLLWWEPCGDELVIRFKLEGYGGGYIEMDTDWTAWIELQDLNPEHVFEHYGCSEERPRYFLCHVGYGTFKRASYR